MQKLFRFSNWRLRSKMALLIVVASVLPLIFAAILDIRGSQKRLLETTSARLVARCEQFRDKLDEFHRSNLRSSQRVAMLPDARAYLNGSQDPITTAKLASILAVWPQGDPRIRGVALLDSAGKVRLSTQTSLSGLDLSSRSYIRDALRTRSPGIVSDVYLAEPQVNYAPTIGYVSCVFDANKTLGAVVLFVDANAFWQIASSLNGLVGSGSFAVVYDHMGIRIAHTFNRDILFHPGGPLDAKTLQGLIAENRFGPKTKELLEDVHPFAEQFDRAKAEHVDSEPFHGHTPTNNQPHMGTASRCETVAWTVFYMISEESLSAQMDELAFEKAGYAGAILVLAVVVGSGFATWILRPVRDLSTTAAQIESGNLAARVPTTSNDEFGQLGARFNDMANQIETTSKMLQAERDDLDARVQERTADLLQTTQSLESEIAERKNAEKALAEGRHLLEAIIENAPAIVYVKDLDGRYLVANRHFCELFRVSKENLIGKTDYDFLPENTADGFRAMDKMIAQSSEAILKEDFGQLEDGPHYYHSVKCPLRDETGKTYATFGISTDITDRKRAENSLRAREERIRQIVETALDAVVTINDQGNITGWNSQAELTFGYSRDDILGLNLADTIVPESYREFHRKGLENYLSTGVSTVLNRRIQLSAVHKDGREFPIELSITPIKTENTFEFSAFIRDISDQRAFDQKVQGHLERLSLLHNITRATGERQDLQSIFQVVIRSLEDQLPIDFGCVCLFDPIDYVLTVSSVGVQSESLSFELALTEHAMIPIDENGLSSCVRGQLVYEPDISKVHFPFPERLAKGGLRSLVMAPLLVESQVFGILVTARREPESFSSGECEFLRQLSEHVALSAHQANLHEALQEAYDDLRQTQQAVMQQERLKALGQMASGIAHDINNAISPVALYTESLLANEEGLSARARDYLETIARSIDDVAATVSRMREFYRQREPQLLLVEIPLNRLMQEVADLTRARWSDMPLQRGVKIDLNLDLESDLPPVMGIESEIREMLTNLVFNAVDAMPDGGALTLRTCSYRQQEVAEGESPRTEVEVDVIDNGIGMDEETQRRCLEPFFTTKGERGTGLGMAMVYGVAQRHNATMKIESAPGQGTTVRLIFDAAATNGDGKPSVVWQASVLQPMRILLIDDDPLLLKSLRDTLEGQGHLIAIANGGQAGIDAFNEAADAGQPFPVVFTDLGMPYVDGRKVAAAIKGRLPSTYIILLTGWGQRLVAEGDIPPHVDSVLNKPPKLRDIHDALAKSLEMEGGEQ